MKSLIRPSSKEWRGSRLKDRLETLFTRKIRLKRLSISTWRLFVPSISSHAPTRNKSLKNRRRWPAFSARSPSWTTWRLDCPSRDITREPLWCSTRWLNLTKLMPRLSVGNSCAYQKEDSSTRPALISKLWKVNLGAKSSLKMIKELFNKLWQI